MKKLESKIRQVRYVIAMCASLLIALSINSIKVVQELHYIKGGIEARTKNFYSALDAAKDNKIQDQKITDLDRRLTVLEKSKSNKSPN